MKYGCRIFFVLMYMLVWGYGQEVFGQSEYAGEGTSMISVTTHSDVYVKNSFKGTGQAMDVVLYRLELKYYPFDTDASLHSIHLQSIAFELTDLSGITPASVGEMRLVVSSLATSGYRVIAKSTINIAEKIVLFKLDHELHGITLLSLEGDFPHLAPHAEVRVKLMQRFLIAKDMKERKPVRVNYIMDYEVWHHEGNSSPIIDYSPFLPHGNKGLTPPKGRSGDIFTFEMTYKDRDGDVAERAELWLDLNENNIFEENEKFALQSDNNNETWLGISDQRYRITMRIIPQKTGNIMYQFFAFDGKDKASGPATSVAHMEINPAIIIHEAHVSSLAVVPGETFTVSYPMRYFFDRITIDWHSVATNDFSPFIFVDMTHKDKRPSQSDINYDEEMLIISLRVPVSARLETAAVPSLIIKSLWYDMEVKQETSLEVFAPEVTISIVPLRAWFELLPSRALITIGDAIVLRFTILSIKGIELVSKPDEEMKFPFFTVHPAFGLIEEEKDQFHKRVYAGILYSFMAVGAEKRTTPIGSYRLEYRLQNEEAIHHIDIPEHLIEIMPILTENEITGPPLVVRRIAIDSALRFGTESLTYWFFVQAYCFVVVAGLMIIVPLSWLGISFMRKGTLARQMIARWAWMRDVRAMKQAGFFLSSDRTSVCERSFRRYLSYIYGCSEEEAQSVMLWQYVDAPSYARSKATSDIKSSLVWFTFFSQAHGSKEQWDNLIEVQYALRASI